MLICDTGPLVAAAVAKDPDHHACVELFTGVHLAGRRIVIPAPVVAEVGYLLGRIGGAEAEALFLESLADGDFAVEELTADDYADGRTGSTVRRFTVGYYGLGGNRGRGTTT